MPPSKLSFLAIGAIGAGFYEESLNRGLRDKVDFIGADAGSTDPGPIYLATGGGSFSRQSCARDLRLLLQASRAIDVPLLIGSCGTSGSNWGVDYFADIIRDIAREEGHQFKLAKIYAEVPRVELVSAVMEDRIEPLYPEFDFDVEAAKRSVRAVGVMGAEPFQQAVGRGAKVVLAGRATDTAIFSALPLVNGVDPAIAWHAGKVAECGTSAAEPRRRLDVLRIDLDSDSFLVTPLRDDIRCTPFSVSSVQLHETSDPFVMHEPGWKIHLSDVEYQQENASSVRVSGARAERVPYTNKIESVESAGFQKILVFSVRDPTILASIDQWNQDVRFGIEERVAELLRADTMKQVTLSVRTYGLNGTMGPLESNATFEGHEACLVVDVVAPDRETTEAVFDVVDYAYLHAKSPRWRGHGTMAFPFSSKVFTTQETFQFNANHVMKTDDPMALFSLEIEEV